MLFFGLMERPVTNAPLVCLLLGSFVKVYYLNFDFVGAGGAFNLNWHALPFLCFLFLLRLVVLHYALAD